jgi:putative hydrolase of the HAD superfamily
MKYKAILFDLDDTLYDRKYAIQKLSEELYNAYSIKASRPDFCARFVELDNNGYSNRLENIKILRREFGLILDEASYQKLFHESMIRNSQICKNGYELLHSLKSNGIKTGIITNGQSKLQRGKIDRLNIENLLDCIVISEEVGFKKPDSRIFEHALCEIGCAAKECIFVGDNYEIDFQGCSKVGMRGLLYNPDRKTINKLCDTLHDLQEVLNVV